MTAQDIEKLKALCEKEGFEIKESHEGQTFFIKKSDDRIRVKLDIYTINSLRDEEYLIRTSSTKPIRKEMLSEELKNHIEESIEAFLNRKP